MSKVHFHCSKCQTKESDIDRLHISLVDLPELNWKYIFVWFYCIECGHENSCEITVSDAYFDRLESLINN